MVKVYLTLLTLSFIHTVIWSQEFKEYIFLDSCKIEIPSDWKIASDYTKESFRQFYNLETGKEYTKGKVQLLAAGGKKRNGIMTIQFSYRFLDGSISVSDLKLMKEDLVGMLDEECEQLKKDLLGLTGITSISDCITKYIEVGDGIGASLKYLKKDEGGEVKIIEIFHLFKENIKYTLTFGIPFEELVLWESTRSHIIDSIKL